MGISCCDQPVIRTLHKQQHERDSLADQSLEVAGIAILHLKPHNQTRIKVISLLDMSI